MLWITSAWSSLDHASDTTLRLIEAACDHGWHSVWCDRSGLVVERGQLIVRAASVLNVRERSRSGFDFGPAQEWPLTAFRSVQLREDPPIDLPYLQTLQLLALGSIRQRREVQFTNPIEALLDSTSKLELLRIDDLCPPTLVSRDWARLDQFGRRQRRVIIKPVNSCRSAGVQRLDWQTRRGRDSARRIIEALSDDFHAPVILQADLGRASIELRLWLLDGAPLAVARKVWSSSGEEVGLCRARLTVGQTRTVATLGRHLRSRRIRLAAVDMIKGYVIDLNYASPGMLVEMEALTGRDLAGQVVNALNRRAVFRPT